MLQVRRKGTKDQGNMGLWMFGSRALRAWLNIFGCIAVPLSPPPLSQSPKQMLHMQQWGCSAKPAPKWELHAHAYLRESPHSL